MEKHNRKSLIHFKSAFHFLNKELEDEPSYEVVERKGFGHPDTIADCLATLISRAYSNYTIINCDGLILHHQIDKLMVIGGDIKVSWGEGKFLKKIKIIVAGRASNSYLNKRIPIYQIIQDTINAYFAKYFPLIDVNKNIEIINELTPFAGPGTITESKGSIKNMFSPVSKNKVRGYEKYVSNDTSFCTGFYPYTRLELFIINLEKSLNSVKFKENRKWLGSDIKILGVRIQYEIQLTLCIPQIAFYVNSLKEYQTNIADLNEYIREQTNNSFDSKFNISISINTKDDLKTNNFYLTYSGASLSGDIGVVGRGNRHNGVISSNRPQSMEGVSGKNPRYYSGFIFSLFSQELAKKLYSNFGFKNQVIVLSQNGAPLKKPWKVIIEGNTNIDIKMIEDFVYKELDNISLITKKFVESDYLIGY